MNLQDKNLKTENFFIEPEDMILDFNEELNSKQRLYDSNWKKLLNYQHIMLEEIPKSKREKCKKITELFNADVFTNIVENNIKIKTPDLLNKKILTGTECLKKMKKNILIDSFDVNSTLDVNSFEVNTLEKAEKLIVLANNYVSSKNTSVKNSYNAGYILFNVANFCESKKIDLNMIMKKLKIKTFSGSYSYFLRKFYQLIVKYPKIKNVNLPISFFKNNMRRITTTIKSNEEESVFWKTI